MRAILLTVLGSAAIAACSSGDSTTAAQAAGSGGAPATSSSAESTGASTGAGAASSSASTSAGGSGGGGTALPLGSVSNAMMEAKCMGGNTVAGATCQHVVVSCPGIDDRGAEIAIASPNGTAKGTVMLHNGSGGTTFMNTAFGDDYLKAGFRVVQVAWDSPWEWATPASLLAAACRPATIFRWAFDNVHEQDAATGFCVQGHSGGSGAISYTLAHYDGESFIDYALVSAGPPFGRIDYGCDPKSYTGAPIALCPQIADAPIAYNGSPTNGPIQLLDGAEGTMDCGTANVTQAERDKWAADSVASPGADYDYGQVPIDFWYCATKPNETTGLGYFYASQIKSPSTITCRAQGCMGEGVFNDPQNHADMESAMAQECVPH